jgi:septum formation protein
MHQLILASQSPRRRTLLEQAGFPFHTFPVKVSENLEKNLILDDQILAISRSKAEAAFNEYKPLNSGPFLFLSADTLVVLDGTPLGKPKDSTEATSFLLQLSGKWHSVKTAITLVEAFAHNLSQNETAGGALKKVKTAEAITTTLVQFRELTEVEIANYVHSGEPMDKAGAYGIQGEAGKFVNQTDGPIDNVIGLPIETLRKMLKENSWTLV